MIRGYPAWPSVAPGGTLVLHVSTDAPRFRVAFHRFTAEGWAPVHDSAWLDGLHAPDGLPQDDWHWPAYRFDTGRDWPHGVYLAHLVESVAPLPAATWMDSAAALFVVRGPGRSPLLYKLPFATWQAYNASGGACFYHRPPQTREHPPGARMSWHRPGGGIGGMPFGAADHYDSRSPRQTFAHWDAPMLRWLLREGFEPEPCADLDLHREGAALLAPHRLLLSAGHDEYWSDALRDAVQAFAERGGHVAFFGGNTCWWRIHFVDGDSAMVCHQGGPQGALDHWWPPTGVHRPEDGLSGVSYRHGGGWWDGPREAGGLVVQDGSHWVFEGTGLRTGDVFAHACSPPLPGYECDGAPLVWADRARGLVRLAPEAAECGTPASFVPLAVGALAPGWQELPHREHHAAWEGLHSGTLGLHRRGAGTVFTTGSTDWAQVLGNGSDAAVEVVTRNVVRRLSQALAG